MSGVDGGDRSDPVHGLGLPHVGAADADGIRRKAQNGEKGRTTGQEMRILMAEQQLYSEFFSGPRFRSH